MGIFISFCNTLQCHVISDGYAVQDTRKNRVRLKYPHIIWRWSTFTKNALEKGFP